jgi:hypothetical protein
MVSSHLSKNFKGLWKTTNREETIAPALASGGYILRALGESFVLNILPAQLAVERRGGKRHDMTLSHAYTLHTLIITHTGDAS